MQDLASGENYVLFTAIVHASYNCYFQHISNNMLITNMAGLLWVIGNCVPTNIYPTGIKPKGDSFKLIKNAQVNFKLTTRKNWADQSHYILHHWHWQVTSGK